jgi:hypothetical protein
VISFVELTVEFPCAGGDSTLPRRQLVLSPSLPLQKPYGYCCSTNVLLLFSLSLLPHWLFEKLTYGQIAPVFEYVHDLMFSKNNSLSNLRVAISNVGSYYTCTITEYLIRLFSQRVPPRNLHDKPPGHNASIQGCRRGQRGKSVTSSVFSYYKTVLLRVIASLINHRVFLIKNKHRVWLVPASKAVAV